MRSSSTRARATVSANGVLMPAGSGIGRGPGLPVCTVILRTLNESMCSAASACSSGRQVQRMPDESRPSSVTDSWPWFHVSSTRSAFQVVPSSAP